MCLCFYYFCRRFYGERFFGILRGNQVQILNSTRCCKFHNAIDIKSLSVSRWEGVYERNKSEDLPYNHCTKASGGRLCKRRFLGFRLSIFSVAQLRNNYQINNNKLKLKEL